METSLREILLRMKEEKIDVQSLEERTLPAYFVLFVDGAERQVSKQDYEFLQKLILENSVKS